MVVGSKMRMHKYNIYCQFSELKWLKGNLKEDEVILSANFLKNYKSKIQSAYFEHESLTIFIAAFYFHESITVENGNLDEESNLLKLPVAIILNETIHDQNVTCTNNNLLISMVKQAWSGKACDHTLILTTHTIFSCDNLPTAS